MTNVILIFVLRYDKILLSVNEKERKQITKNIKIELQKTLDKKKNMWYNIIVER